MLPYFKSLISCVTAYMEWFDRAKNGRKRRMKEESTECRRCINWRQRMRARTHRLTTHQFLLELFRNIHEDSSVLQLKFKERSCCYIDHFRQFWTWRKSKLWSNEWWARGKSNIHTDFSRSPTVFVPTKRAKVKVNPKLKRQNWNLPDWEDIDCDRSQVERRAKWAELRTDQITRQPAGPDSTSGVRSVFEMIRSS